MGISFIRAHAIR